ncbi:MAG: hypothetical protein CL570_02980 [Alphaproteobacteria bacterium]|nr:hypothetical protein [Alphaproteobacteria bacterium]HCQ70996.1 hypothetical protein [Rhodospirillaceae bacterium]|tara:strand:- start:15428 stop:16582 length:1155 start_codon:yes stop_codon:yes gene_type:complete
MCPNHTHHITALNTLAQHLTKTPSAHNWPEDWLTLQSAQKIESTFAGDMAALNANADFIFTEIDNISHATTLNAALFDQWHQTGAPSLYALTCYALDRLALPIAPDLKQAALLSALLGSITNTLPYHNNMHYAKVLVQTLRLIIAHNHIFADTTNALGDNETIWMIIAACLHDVGHDGTGNTVRGIHKPSRLEQRSLDIALPQLETLGFDRGSHEMRRLIAMIIATDVTPIDDPSSPARQMKAAYRAHMLAGSADSPLNLDASLSILEHDKKASLMALLLHEADLATSSGLTYAVTARETILIHQEHHLPPARPQHIVGFLKHICQRKVLSDAAQKIYAANLARIYARAEQDTENGNEKLEITHGIPQESAATSPRDNNDTTSH